MNKETNSYTMLKQALKEGFSWPCVYLFKFIVLSQKSKVSAIEKAFEKEKSPLIRKTFSKNGKYVSMSIALKMKDPCHVIEKYKTLSTIEGVISL